MLSHLPKLCARAIGLIALQCAAAQAPPTAQTLAQIDAFIERERVQSRIPGIALAVVHQGRIVAVRGYGTRGEGERVTGDTPFPVGSLTESFTAILVRQLVEAGRIDIDAPVQRYLPWFTVAVREGTARITVRHLLNQTSGLSREDGLRAVLTAGNADVDELSRRVVTMRPTAKPGERFQYSNLNYVLLGALVQAVEGKPWSQLVSERVLRPVGMLQSVTSPDAAPSMTQLHRYVFGLPVTASLSFAPGLAPTGALVSSANDMARYLAMLLSGGTGTDRAVLSPSAVASLLAPASPPATRTLLGTGFDFRYGEGWFVGDFGSALNARWHLGNLATFAAWMVVLPEQQLGIVVLMNANSELPLFKADSTFSRIPIGIIDLLSGQTPPAGTSVSTAYMKLNAALATVTATLAILCWMAARSRRIWPSAGLAVFAAVTLLIVGMGDLGVRGWFFFAPDLASWLIFVAIVCAIPMTGRLACRRSPWFARRSRGPRRHARHPS